MAKLTPAEEFGLSGLNLDSRIRIQVQGGSTPAEAQSVAKELVGDRSQSSPGAQALEQAVMKIDETLRKG